MIPDLVSNDIRGANKCVIFRVAKVKVNSPFHAREQWRMEHIELEVMGAIFELLFDGFPQLIAAICCCAMLVKPDIKVDYCFGIQRA